LCTHYLYAPQTDDPGLRLTTADNNDLIGAITDALIDNPTTVDLYYFSYYELVGEGMIFPQATLLNSYLRRTIKAYGDVPLALEQTEQPPPAIAGA